MAAHQPRPAQCQSPVLAVYQEGGQVLPPGQDQADGLYRSIQDYAGLYNTIQDYTGIYRTLQDYTGLNRIIPEYT